MKKYHNDKGEIGLVISSGFGAGWSSRNREYKDFLLMDHMIVTMCMHNTPAEEVQEYLADHEMGDVYMEGWDDCHVVFLPPNSMFYLHEYDGSETLITKFDNTGE
jgi:hypothetical protein